MIRPRLPALRSRVLAGCTLALVAVLVPACSDSETSTPTTDPGALVTDATGPDSERAVTAAVIPEPLDGTVLVSRGPDDPVSTDRVVRAGDGGSVSSGQTFTVPGATEVNTIAVEVVADGPMAGRAASIELYRFDDADATEPSERVGGPSGTIWQGLLPALPEGEAQWLSFEPAHATVLEPGVRYGVLLALGGQGDGVLWLQHQRADGEQGLQRDGSRWRNPAGASTLLVQGASA